MDRHISHSAVSESNSPDCVHHRKWDSEEKQRLTPHVVICGRHTVVWQRWADGQEVKSNCFIGVYSHTACNRKYFLIEHMINTTTLKRSLLVQYNIILIYMSRFRFDLFYKPIQRTSFVHHPTCVFSIWTSTVNGIRTAAHEGHFV